MSRLYYWINKLKFLNKHTYDKRCQVKHYKELKQNLKSMEITFHVDFSKNYKNQQQHEVHTGYFIFRIVCSMLLA